jgi:hypothetical protein
MSAESRRGTMFVLRLVVACAVLLSAGPACGLFSREPAPPPSLLHEDVLVEVESHNWSDITIYLLTAGLPQRLGMVTAMGNGSFAFPSQRLNTAGSVRLRALPVAGSAFTSEAILVQPGQAIMWRLENDLDISSLSVY